MAKYMIQQAIFSLDPDRPAWHPAEQPRRTEAKLALRERREERRASRAQQQNTTPSSSSSK